MSGRYVQSAVCEYSNGEGRMVTLVCCLHTAPVWYYARIRTLLNGLQYTGSAIHSEGAPLLPTSDPNADESRVLDKMRHYRDMERRLLAQRGWADRYDALPRGQRWQVHDLSLLEVIRRAGVPACEKYADRLVSTYTTASHSREAAAVLWQMEDDILRAACARDEARDPTGLSEVLVVQRARVALDAMRSTDRDLVLVWGPAQMPDLHAGLAAHGFTRTRAPGWVTVARLGESCPTTAPIAAVSGAPA